MPAPGYVGKPSRRGWTPAMAWNLVRTYRAAPAIAPQPLLPVDPSQVRA